MQKLQIQIDKAVNKVDALTKKYDELKNKKIPTQEYKNLQEKLSSALKELEKLKAQDSKLASLDVKIQKLSQSSAEYAAKMKEVAEQKIPTQEYKEVQKQIENTTKKINDLEARQEKLLASGGKRDSSTYKRMEYDLEQLRNSLPYLKGELQELVDTGKDFTLGTDTEKYQSLSLKYEAVNQELEKQKGLHSEIAQKQAGAVQKVIELKAQMNQLVEEGKDFTIGDQEEINSAFNDLEMAKAELRMLITKMDEMGVKPKKVSDGLKKIGSAAKKAFGAVNSEVKKSSGHLSTFTSRLKGIAMSLLIFNWISKAFNAMISGMKTGFQNFMGYSSDFANSIQGMKNAMSTLGNQFAAAFAPIIQMVVPWLTQLINVISTAMTYVAQFIAILGGKSTFTRAKQIQDSYNKSLNGTASAAKKAAGALAKFDDLDVLQKKEEDSGGGVGGTDPSQMFEEVPVDSKFKNWLDGILEKIKPILDYFEKLKDIFLENFFDTLDIGGFDKLVATMKEGIEEIKSGLAEVFTDPNVITAMNRFVENFAAMLGAFTGMVVIIGATIAANLLKGLGDYIQQNKEFLKEKIANIFNVGGDIEEILTTTFKNIAKVFSVLAEENGIRVTTAIIGIFNDAFLELVELGLKFGRELLNVILLPFNENSDAIRITIDELLGSLATVLEGFKISIDSIFGNTNAVYDAHFKPFFDSVAKGISYITGKLLGFWNGNVQPVLDNAAKRLSDLLTNCITPLANSAINLFGSIADALKILWEKCLIPVIDWINDNVLPTIIPILETIYNTVVTVIGDVADFLTGFVNIVKGIIDLIVNLVNGDWAGAWESAKDIVENVFNTILAFAQTIWDSFIGVIGSALQIVVGIFQVTFMGIYDFLAQIFINMYDSTIEIWTEITEWLTENFNSFQEFISCILENILLFFTETWESITLLFQEFIDFINDTVIPIWQESWDMAGSLFQSFHDLINQLINAIKVFLDGFMKTVKLLIDGDWKGAWENAKNIFEAFKGAVESVIGTIRDIIQSFFDWVMGIVSEIISAIESIGSSISGIFGGDSGFSGKTALTAASALPYSFADVPHLANGAVIRGGNPYVAVLGDQRPGQTNVETPLSTIKQAVREEMSGMNLGGGPAKIVLNLNGVDVGEAMIDDLFAVMKRQGYDVDVLGVT